MKLLNLRGFLTVTLVCAAVHGSSAPRDGGPQLISEEDSQFWNRFLNHQESSITLSPTKAPPTESPSTNLPNLVVKGDNGSPSSAFPLQRCEGDCDDDDDCAMGLVCYQRNTRKRVPGCGGTPRKAKDYCVRPSDLAAPVPAPDPRPVPRPVAKPVARPVARPVPRSVPTASPVPVPKSSKGKTPRPNLVVKGSNGSPASAFPLKRCQGDCNDDDDCATGLVCYQRNPGQQPVPGCRGTPREGKDYCVRESDKS